MLSLLIIQMILAFEMDWSITDSFVNEWMLDIFEIFTGINNKTISNKFV